MAKPMPDILDLIAQIGVKNVVLRFLETSGTVQEQLIAIADFPADAFTNGVPIPGDDGRTVFPDKASTMMNPFLDTPSLAIVCYLNKKDAVGNSPISWVNSGGITPRMITISPAMAGLSAGGLGSGALLPTINFSGIPPIVIGAGVGGAVGVLGTPAGAAIDGAGVGLSSRLGSGGSSGASGGGGTAEHMQPLDIDDPADLDDGMGTGSPRRRAQRGHHGSSCHQCKNIRSAEALAFCHHTFAKRTGSGERVCRKKFCGVCLRKFYNDSLEQAHTDSQWVCPSCRGICSCAACQRHYQGMPVNLPPGSYRRKPTANSSSAAQSHGSFGDDNSQEEPRNGHAPGPDAFLLQPLPPPPSALQLMGMPATEPAMYGGLPTLDPLTTPMDSSSLSPTKKRKLTSQSPRKKRKTE